MRILFVASGLGIGGAEQILYQLSKGVISRGNELRVINLFQGGAYESLLTKLGVNTISLGIPTSKKVNLCAVLDLIKGIRELDKEIREYKPDVIHSWLYPADLLSGILGRYRNVPVVWGIFSGKVDKKFYKHTTHLVMKLCGIFSGCLPTIVVSCSAYGRRSHVSLGYKQSSVIYVPTGFDIGLFDTSIANIDRSLSRRIKGNAVVVGMLGRYTVEKRHDLLIEAVGCLRRSGLDIELVLAGGVGIEKNNEELTNCLKKANVESCTTLLGTVDSKDTLFSQIDIFCLFSDTEGFPTVVGEAMVYGLPCLVSNAGDSKIIIADELQILAALDLDNICKSLFHLSELGPNNWETIGQRNRSRIVKLFPAEKMVDRYLSVYNAVV